MPKPKRENYRNDGYWQMATREWKQAKNVKLVLTQAELDELNHAWKRFTSRPMLGIVERETR